MADIAPISHHNPLYGPAGSRVDASPPASTPTAPAGRNAGESAPSLPEAPSRMPARPSDRVELSDRARLLSKLAALPEMRTELVNEIRAAIARGEYDTSERLDEALSAMIEEIEQE